MMLELLPNLHQPLCQSQDPFSLCCPALPAMGRRQAVQKVHLVVSFKRKLLLERNALGNSQTSLRRLNFLGKTISIQYP
jgi:hypothetical protein